MGRPQNKLPRRRHTKNVNEKTTNSSSQIQLLGFSSSSASSSAS
jgi:hypothetical protein